MINQIFLCTHRSEPSAANECREAIWSLGASCANCWVKCYRAGWSAARVGADNKQRVEEKTGEQND